MIKGGGGGGGGGDYGGGDGAVCFTELMGQKPSNRNVPI